MDGGTVFFRSHLCLLFSLITLKFHNLNKSLMLFHMVRFPFHPNRILGIRTLISYLDPTYGFEMFEMLGRGRSGYETTQSPARLEHG